MASHPHDRLQRHLIGQGLARVRPEMEKLFERREKETRRLVQLPEPRKLGGRRVRRISPRIEAAPNAPQLIRLIRHPYTLDRGTFKRSRSSDRGMVLREQRESYRVVLDQALHAPRRVSGFRPMRERKRLEARARPSIEGWLVRKAGE